jgi:hypothetical protein
MARSTWGYDRAGSALDDAPIVEVKRIATALF